MNSRPLFASLLATAFLSAVVFEAHAEKFRLQSNETIEGAVVRSSGNTLSIVLSEHGMRQLPINEVDHVEIELRSGELVIGELIGWSSRGYEIQAGDRLLRVMDGELTTDAASLAAPAEEAERRENIGGPRIALNKPEREPEAARDTEAETAEASTGKPMLTGSSTPVDESAGDATIRLTLSKPTTEPIAVIYSAIDQAAKNGDDYRDSAGVAIISAGKTSADINVPIVDDELAEPDEEFEIFLTVDPEAAIIEDRRIITMIRDDDS